MQFTAQTNIESDRQTLHYRTTWEKNLSGEKKIFENQRRRKLGLNRRKV